MDIIKFICKDFWQAVFRKQVDNLKTNHRVGGPCQGGCCTLCSRLYCRQMCCADGCTNAQPVCLGGGAV